MRWSEQDFKEVKEDIIGEVAHLICMDGMNRYVEPVKKKKVYMDKKYTNNPFGSLAQRIGTKTVLTGKTGDPSLTGKMILAREEEQ